MLYQYIDNFFVMILLSMRCKISEQHTQRTECCISNPHIFILNSLRSCNKRLSHILFQDFFSRWTDQTKQSVTSLFMEPVFILN
jgi:hypothetical protein